MRQPLVSLGILSLFYMCICQLAWAQNPPAYEASWHAGMFGISQNPAAIAAASSRGEFLLGGINLSAQNNLFETDEIEQFFPTRLLGGLSQGPDSLAFLTDPAWEGFSPKGEGSWFASQQNQFQALGGFWRLETDPDWVERGIARRVFSLRLEREELIQINDVDNGLARAYAQRFNADALTGNSFEDDYFNIRVQSWDALAANFALSFGRGKNLLHFGIGAKLLSAGAFMDLKAYGNRLEFQGNNQLSLQSDSVIFTYNPSFERAVGNDQWEYPSIQRRYNNFENAWGVAAEAGLIYQIFNYDRQPVAEVGVALKNIGIIQFWNLNQTRYHLPETATNYDLFQSGQMGVDRVNNVLQTLADDTTVLSRGLSERLPLVLASHARFNLGKKGWGVHLRGNFLRTTIDAPWETLVRATLFYERRRQPEDTDKKKGRWGIFIPVSSTLVLPSPTTIQLRPRVGLFISYKKRLIIGSNDLLTTMFYSSIRQGVAATHIFIGAHFPIAPNYE